jgi:hypothetical protein
MSDWGSSYGKSLSLSKNKAILSKILKNRNAQT